MKYILSIISILLISASVFAQGVMEIKNPDIKLKNLKADTQPTTVKYKIKNTGNQPVIITRISPYSNLLTADWNKQPIAPGKTEEISISFKPTDMQENFEVRIMVYSNSQPNRIELTLSGNLTDNPEKPELLYKTDLEGIRFKTNNINFNKVFTYQTVCDTLYFINTRKDSVKIGIQYQPDYITTKAIPANIAPGKKGMIIVTFNAEKKNDYGYIYETIVLSINNATNYNNRLSISANITEDFSKLNKKQLSEAPVGTFDKKEVNFGDIKPGAKANCDFTLTNTGKSVLLIRKTKASCGCTAVALGEKSVAPGKSTVIRATFDSNGKSGRQYKTITIITNDPQTPETTLNINGNIQ